ncbi:6211_t:CDS:2, partial [Paraglomus brasilianum]
EDPADLLRWARDIFPDSDTQEKRKRSDCFHQSKAFQTREGEMLDIEVIVILSEQNKFWYKVAVTAYIMNEGAEDVSLEPLTARQLLYGRWTIKPTSAAAQKCSSE